MIAGVTFAVLIDILVIGSRMGLLLFLIATVAAWFLLRGRFGAITARDRRDSPFPSRHAQPRARRFPFFLPAALGALVAAIGILMVYSDRFVALTRLTAGGGGEEGRLTYIPPVLELVQKYFPFGSGFGTFPTVFKIDEPDNMLRLSYLNHAHNDVLEILVEGGVVSAALALGFMVVWLAHSMKAWTTRVDVANNDRIQQARLGSVLSGLLLLGSATDYPLRTPACAAIFAIACFWLFRKGGPSLKG
jgi:O-antigen ligase